jgi:hypothetical protein
MAGPFPGGWVLAFRLVLSAALASSTLRDWPLPAMPAAMPAALRDSDCCQAPPCASSTHGDCQMTAPLCSKANPGGCFCQYRLGDSTCPQGYKACCDTPKPTPAPPPTPVPPTPPPTPQKTPWGPPTPPSPPMPSTYSCSELDGNCLSGKGNMTYAECQSTCVAKHPTPPPTPKPAPKPAPPSTVVYAAGGSSALLLLLLLVAAWRWRRSRAAQQQQTAL